MYCLCLVQFLNFPQYVHVLCNVSLVSLYYFPNFTFSWTKIEKEEKYPNLVFLSLKEENNCKNVSNILLWEELITKCHIIHVENASKGAWNYLQWATSTVDISLKVLSKADKKKSVFHWCFYSVLKVNLKQKKHVIFNLHFLVQEAIY